MNRFYLTIAVMAVFLTGCGGATKPKVSSFVAPAQGHKVVVIVVDSLTNQAIQSALRDTNLPALRYVAKRGQYVQRVVSSFPSMSVSDFSTMLTGTYPEDHRIPGLVWFDTTTKQIVNYGNNSLQTLTLGTRSVSHNALYELNESHLSKRVRTVFEDLQDAGYRTGAINMLVYRGRTPHQLTVPTYARPFVGQASYTVRAADTFVFGQLTSQSIPKGKDGLLQRLGLNDDYATDALVNLIAQGKLPDFTMVYLPQNDTEIHKHGVNAMKGISNVDKNLQKVLASYGSWDKTLQNLTLIVMGDGGVTPILPKERHPTIEIKDLFPDHTVYQWGTKLEASDDIALAVNSRMVYLYLLNDTIQPAGVVHRLQRERRIDVMAWTVGDKVFVTNPENVGSPFTFSKGGPVTDPYGQTWTVNGNLSILDMHIDTRRSIEYGKYPDALHQLWSAAHCQPGRYVIVTAKRGYQFGDERAPTHDGGAQQASMLDEDVVAPIIINGTTRPLHQPSRFVDLKKYFVALVTSSN